ncbi:MAG: hypothetical protein HFJ35_03060 [Clostridia bacterium]|nr:hypothetical protein [Clostridia bacterium]
MKKKIRLKLTSLLVAFATIFSFATTPVSAAAKSVSVANTEEGKETMEYADEARELRQKFNAVEPASTTESYKTDYWGYCTVTNTHTGGNHTIYGNQARLCVAFKPLDGNTALSVSLSSFTYIDTIYRYNMVDSDGYYMYVTDWVPITYMRAYNMFYKIWTTGNGGVCDGRTARFHVWVDYK